jgi:2-polyprenyl-3-methyl-5-hydroxy-6-metoxy-1,4-benzoquinol methylase
MKEDRMNGGKSTTTADDWEGHWASFDESASLNPAQHYRHRLVVRKVRSLRPTRLVDIGCGQGDLLGLLSRSSPSARLFGLELSSVGVDRTCLKVPAADVRCVNLLDDDAAAAISDIRADVSTCCEVLEHLDDPVTFLRTATSALAPGSTLIVTVPSGPRSEFDCLIGHRRHYTPSTLRLTLQSAGFVVSQIERCGFPFFNLYRLVVIGRGKRLAVDVADGATSRLAYLAMRGFDVLFRLNLRRSRWGWQLFAIATLPTSESTLRRGA